MSALPVGAMAPDFTLLTMNGTRFSLTEALKRGPVVLAFFKISCPVCQYAMPFLERLYQGYKGKNVSIVGISQNSREDTALFLKEYGITLPIALDDPAKYPASNAFGLTNVPTVFYIAPDGQVEVSSVGWARADISEINQKLAESLRTNATAIFHPNEEVAELKAG